MANLSNINGYFNVTDTGLVNVVNGGLYVTKNSGDAIIGIISSGGNGRPYYLRSNTNGNFAIYDDTACLERLIIASGGDVTISKNLTVTGNTVTLDSSASAGFIVDRANDTSGATYEYKTNGSLKWYTGLRGVSTEDFYLFNNAQGSTALLISSSNNHATFADVIHTTKNGGAVAAISTPRIRLRTDGVIEWGATYNAGTLTWDTNKAVIAAQAGNTLELKANNSTLGIIIDTSGDVLMGNTVVNPASGFSNQRGFGYDNSTGNLQIASTSGNAFVVGRNEASDGTIIELRKESNIVGTLGSNTTSGQMLLDISGSSSNGNIRFVTNSAEVMRMTSAYNVCIGNTAVTGFNEKLNVTGYGIVTENTNGGNRGIFGFFGGTPLLIGTGDGVDVVFRTDNSEKMRITSAGNVAIGTTSTSYKLHVSGTGGTRMSVTNTDTNWAAVQIQASGNQADYIFFKDDTEERARIAALDSSDLVFYNTDSVTERMRIDSSGTIIGTGTYTAGNSIKIFEAQRSGGAVKSDWSYHDSNTTMSFGTSTNHSLILKSNDTERIRVQNNGNVGINTTSPTNLLDIKGNGNSKGLDIHHSNGNIVAQLIHGGSGDEGQLKLYDSNAETVRISGENNIASFINSGNVGIGTTSPNQAGYGASTKALSLKANSSGGESVLELIGLGNTDGDQVGVVNFMSYAETTPLAQILGVRHTSDTSGKLYFKTAGSTVLAMLQDQTAYFYNTLYFSSSGVGSISWGSMGGGTGFGIRGESGRGLSLGSNGVWDKMVIDTNGNVGIADTSAPNRLSVKDTGNLVTRWTGGSTFSLYQNNTDATVLFSANHGGTGTENRFIWQTNAGTTRAKLDENELYIYYSNGSTSMIALRGQGNSYFRVDSVSDKLINFYYGTSNVGQIVTGGTNVLYQSNSDYRLKENVVEMTGALDRVSQLKPSTYNFISQPETQVDGFMAHELQEVVPQAVSGEKDEINEDGTPKYQGVDHSQIVPLLVGAIQELKQEIETLKTQINN